MGTGCVHHKSTKQKLNMKSSTESEVVGASDYLPWTIWLKMFLEAQGYKLTTCYYFQDHNKESAIPLIKNGKKSSRDKTRHIRIRYFFIADVIKRDNLTVKSCRSEVRFKCPVFRLTHSTLLSIKNENFILYSELNII